MSDTVCDLNLYCSSSVVAQEEEQDAGFRFTRQSKRLRKLKEVQVTTVYACCDVFE